MTEKYNIDSVLKSISVICKDADSFFFLRTSGNSLRIKHSLGGGEVLIAIGLFSTISLLAKIYWILKNGKKYSSYKEQCEKFNNLKEQLKDLSIYSEYKSFLRKPRYVEINEMSAFVELIKDFSNDFGLKELPRNQLENVWRSCRNSLLHNCHVGDEIVLTGSVIMNGNYEAEKRIRIHDKSFYFIEDKEKLRAALYKNRMEGGLDIKTILQVSSDTLYVDNFKLDILDIIEWLSGKFNSEEFPENHKSDLKQWLEAVNIFHTYKFKFD